MNNARHSIATQIGRHIRGTNEGLSAFFFNLPMVALATLPSLCVSFASFMSKGDRHFTISALSAAIIKTGDKLDAATSDVTKAMWTRRLNLLDQAQTELVRPDCQVA